MQETPYTPEEIEAIAAHLSGCISAMQNNEESEVLGKVGLPNGYAALAESVYRTMLVRHGIAIRGEAFVMAGLTMGFALGRDFGHVEVLEQTGEVKQPS